jgi:3-deoxy-D-manno-octulosonic-acid transferase
MLYRLAVKSYGFGIWLAQGFNAKAKSWISGRKNIWETFPKLDKEEVYWFHCASLGEFDQGLPLMNQLKAQNPSIFILVTFFSPSGYEHYHKRKHIADFVCYLPLDTKKNANRFIQYFKPANVFFIKYEFWKNYISAAKKQGAKVYSVSAIFRESHRFFGKFGSLFQGVLKEIDFFFVQNQLSVDLLKRIGITNVLLVGDTRFDRVIQNKMNVESDAKIEQFLNGKKAFIIGSSWPEDEQLLKDLVLTHCKQTPVIIAPHAISEGHLLQIEKLFGKEIIRYSELTDQQTNKSILLIDCIGRLANAYSYGKIAYVGGGFSGSLHNILEPAVFGLPVIFGPKHTRFPEGQQFVDEGIGFSISTETELNEAWNFILANLESISEKTANYVQQSEGATQKIINFLHLNKFN